MRTFTSWWPSAAAITLASSGLSLSAGAATAAPAVTAVPLAGFQRHCDFSRDSVPPITPRTGLADGVALIHTIGSQVVAEVHFVDAPQPGTHFDVELIQEPRPASASCAPGQPGVTAAGLDTDASGAATVTVRDTLLPGTTGVWVYVEHPNEHSQNPAEFYSSDFVAPV